MSNKTILAIVAVIGTFIFSVYALNGTENEASNAVPKENSIYEFTVTDIDGESVNLEKYKGKVIMFVNTASECGYTPQYKGLQAIYDKYKDEGFVILGFPANNFGGQEPGTEKEIKEFCTLKYKVTFPMFAKISVKGDDQHPLYSFLTNEKTNPKYSGDVTWNFNKFLADKNGEIIARFSSKEVPESKEITNTIEKAIAENSAE